MMEATSGHAPAAAGCPHTTVGSGCTIGPPVGPFGLASATAPSAAVIVIDRSEVSERSMGPSACELYRHLVAEQPLGRSAAVAKMDAYWPACAVVRARRCTNSASSCMRLHPRPLHRGSRPRGVRWDFSNTWGTNLRRQAPAPPGDPTSPGGS